VSFIKDRLRRLEGRMQGGGRCPECGLPPDGPGRIAVIDDGTPAEGFPDDPGERCERCGRPLWCVVQIVYDEEGEGAIADA
jgi:hypothetical protein